jgi:hypothetical protein
MGTIRHRNGAEIRARALEFAGKKHDEGCTRCAEGYVRLARQHGATEHDFEHVALGRRGFLKMVAGALAAGLTADLLLSAHMARASTWKPDSIDLGFFGVDSCTAPADGSVLGMPMQFYIGELGATQNGLACFNVDTAKAVGLDYTHGYWGLCGPNFMGASGYADAASYGASQAQLALAAWKATPNCGGQTIFADIEAGFGGWGGPATVDQHAALLDAFLETISQAGYVPGVYISDSCKMNWFPPNYVAAVPFVYWVAGGPFAGTMCAPCAMNCYTLDPTAQMWQQSVSLEVFGGMQAVMWQYWLSGFGCSGDFDYSPQTGQGNFVPAPVQSQTQQVTP